jgi:hypothetical protein
VRARHGALLSRWSSPAPAPPPPWVIQPRLFGADPTGVADSSAAFALALDALLARNTSGRQDEGGTTDLGGALLDL